MLILCGYVTMDNCAQIRRSSSNVALHEESGEETKKAVKCEDEKTKMFARLHLRQSVI